ncbi:MAG: hypothetical protein HUJ72_05345 [Blautia sp.]|nr:hypothetical protein [Blautia sp.]
MERSRKCKIDGSHCAAMDAIDATEAFSRVHGLDEMSALHLRLLAEELLGLVGGLTEIMDGNYVIEKEGSDYRLTLSVVVQPIGAEAKRRLMNTSSVKKNLLYLGFSGKLRRIADWYARGTQDTAILAHTNDCFLENGLVHYTNYGSKEAQTDWFMSSLMEAVKLEEKARNWDELEHSVLAQLADDVQIGMRYQSVVITVYKKLK